jgi:DNA-directed RNA polymerase subunit M/transcription elongation factor TFIIS
MFNLIDHKNHAKYYYYPSNKFKFESSEEQIFFSTSKWQRNKNFNMVVNIYEYISRITNHSICPCIVIIAIKLFNCVNLNFQNGSSITKRFFDNQFNFSNHFFTYNLKNEIKLNNLKLLEKSSNMKMYIFNLTKSHDEFDDFVKANSKLFTNSLMESNWKKNFGNSKNKMVISLKLKSQIDSLYSKLINCIEQLEHNNSHSNIEEYNEIYLQLTYFLKTGTLNNFKKENIFKISKNKKSKLICQTFMNKLRVEFSRHYTLSSPTNPQFPFNHLFYKLHHSKIYKPIGVCKHLNVNVSFQQTRCADEIATTIRFCQDCNRII